LADYLSARARVVVRPCVVWVPIAFMQVEAGFDIGPAKVLPITAQILDERETAYVAGTPNQAEEISQLFANLRKKMQGLAAVVMAVEGEPGHAQCRAIDVAADVIGLLRLFSGAAYTPWLLCPCAVLGSEVILRTTSLVFGPSNEFRASEETVGNVGYWNLSAAELTVMRQSGLDKLSGLVDEDGLNEYRRRVRASILAYSKGTTLPDISDRLVYTLSSLEGLLLKDASEPIQQNLGERMAFLIESKAEARQSIVQNVRAAYNMRSQYIHHRVTVVEEDALFVSHQEVMVLEFFKANGVQIDPVLLQIFVIEPHIYVVVDQTGSGMHE